ncbi:MAG: hypothetical protein BGP05_13425 [Rhizobiales bacterium 62-47]|nr:hypothetical protein [Hyphomicrobiales bacterium]MBN9042618.1 hypothetical protein [Hyphomicrobiales bacterium]OJY11249.1 MAG: hypothetical protein BGP05_13425 [Rhizobiales bacterium 62-47]
MHGTIPLSQLAPVVPPTWEPGDDPTKHPLWQEQVELEVEMVQRGVDKYRERVAVAREKGEMTRVKAFHRWVEDAVPEMAKYLKQWLTDVRRKRLGGHGGPSPLAFHKLSGMDASVASYITLRTLLDTITIGHEMPLLAVAKRIGMEIEYQARMQAWVAKAPDVFYGVQKSLHKTATSRHRRRVNINRFNALMRDKLNWVEWPADIKLHVGFRLVDVAVAATKAFNVTQKTYDLVIASRGHRAKAKPSRPQRIITLDEDLQASLLQAVDKDQIRTPQYLPTLMPPKRWDGIRGGGYYTPIVRRPTLIRFHAESEEYREAVLEEYDALDMPRVMAALHYIQETPWMVNRRVLAVAHKLWDMDLGIAGFPKQDILPLPPKPEDIDTNPEAQKQWKRAAAAVYTENATRVSKATSIRTTIQIAERFAHREFYFPHMLDFRGRMYPIPVYLQPQGNDFARGLLAFAKGQEVGEKGGEWLAIHLANHFGADKMSYQGRIDWVKGNEEVWRAIAEDPIKNRNLWLPETGKKHHWQGLAAVFEWVRFLDEGPTMVSGLPIHIDGTCNGIQHLSAMMRDEEGGAAVNLLPDLEPHDIYGDVAAFLQDRLEGIREAGGTQGKYAQMWLDACDGKVPRSLTKRPVMTTPYGATREAHFGSIHDWLREELEEKGRMPFDPKPEVNSEWKKMLVPWLVKHLIDAVDAIVKQSKVCMKWLQDAAKVVAQCNQPIVWRAPSGFVVRHFYGASRQRSTSTLIDGKRINVTYYERTAKLSEREQLQGIPPNFTHSMDAAANTETIIKLALDPRRPPVTAIHDAYGTVAGSMWQIFDAVREAFIKVHSNDVLKDFRWRCLLMYRDHLLATREGLNVYSAMEIAEDTIPPVPERGELDIRVVAESEYFFA